ncbi:N-acetyl-gamma-glutamyl-phosphate reductase [Micromonospora globispora]|uniref:N-acetyl-gamma-glutamyl-phosphate reductase n=1 Tax=Micromonospora globispora TaxID=1450148 RepID=A0A317K867_9ACTN|nr:N-acetyl-gamma-glutamyl-phosphate reductase [Micromonospora globispora]PWU49249.1 N-acetyl-gamma-glutamyl-phosphate reductase [Micromonospora globispora]PWU54008.1 N-acetyl-gamma-glutamyl-phosphate reductase [Micromonospora globispora]RQX00258.1 N-acetyl-gamma-glutamyl-phosphate reductase [Micromonospora globispora]
MGIRVAVAGASGYAGGELLRLVAGHPEFDLVAATAHSQAGRPVTAVHPQLAGLDLVFGETDPATLADADVVFLALPHGESAALAAALPETAKVVDLGADHRLHDADAWARYYGGAHSGAWTYGLPELPGQRAAIAAATRVANTGCYAVATTLALAPLIAAGAVFPTDVVVVAASGTSGAGRSAKAHLLGSEVMGDLSPYKVGAHQHVPEIKQATGATSLSFTPVLAPMPRGILATVTAVPTGDADPRAILAAAYADAPFVHVLPEGAWPHTAATAGSNSCHLQATVDVDSGRVIVVSAIDNLGKGAAGQAVQNANLMLGLPETAGLSAFGVAP